MYTTLTPEQNARILLEVCSQNDVKSNGLLFLGQIWSYAEKNDVRSNEIQHGLDYGETKGWFEEAHDGAIRLTPAGFAEI